MSRVVSSGKKRVLTPNTGLFATVRQVRPLLSPAAVSTASPGMLGNFNGITKVAARVDISTLMDTVTWTGALSG
jgi:hypothetical protein